MTVIDAAIIKALVEHIGDDSSNIPDGPVDVGSGTIPYEIEPHPANVIVSNLTVSGNNFVITDAGTKPLFAPGSTVLKLKRKDNDEWENWLCNGVSCSTLYNISYSFINLINPSEDNMLFAKVSYNDDGTFKTTLQNVAPTYQDPNTWMNSVGFIHRIKFKSSTDIWSVFTSTMENQYTMFYRLWANLRYLYKETNVEITDL